MSDFHEVARGSSVGGGDQRHAEMLDDVEDDNREIELLEVQVEINKASTGSSMRYFALMVAENQ